MFTQLELQNSAGKPIENIFRFSHKAMATVFEVYIYHDNPQYAEQSAFEAFLLVDQLERDLSRFIENSDISRIKAAKPYEPVGLSYTTFECLEDCITLHEKTGGVFDITIGNLMNVWLDKEKKLRTPSAEEIELAKQRTGLQHLVLDAEEHVAFVLQSPLILDLGGYGKGYAVDKMAEFLRDWEINRALIHGGASSVFAMDPPDGLPGWPLTISLPQQGKIIAWLYLKDRALSGSGLQKGQHILDPRTCFPVQGNVAAWASGKKAATADGLSTAFMILKADEVGDFCKKNPDIAAVIISPAENSTSENAISWYGDWSFKVNEF
jgi:thiamine biosynthesis lipoprotein